MNCESISIHISMKVKLLTLWSFVGRQAILINPPREGNYFDLLLGFNYVYVCESVL